MTEWYRKASQKRLLIKLYLSLGWASIHHRAAAHAPLLTPILVSVYQTATGTRCTRAIITARSVANLLSNSPQLISLFKLFRTPLIMDVCYTLKKFFSLFITFFKMFLYNFMWLFNLNKVTWHLTIFRKFISKKFFK